MLSHNLDCGEEAAIQYLIHFNDSVYRGLCGGLHHLVEISEFSSTVDSLFYLPVLNWTRLWPVCSERCLGGVDPLEPVLFHLRPWLPWPHPHMQAAPERRRALPRPHKTNQVLQHRRLPRWVISRSGECVMVFLSFNKKSIHLLPNTRIWQWCLTPDFTDSCCFQR